MSSPQMSAGSSLSRVASLFSLYRGLPRSVYILFIAEVVNGIGVFVFPFLTLYLTKKVGMSDQAAGNVIMLTSLAYVPGVLLGGRIADRFGRKRLMLIASFLSAAMYIPCGFLNGSPLVAVFAVISVLFDGFADPARSAMQADLTNPGNRQAAFSLQYLGHNLGFAIGPLIAGFLFNNAPQWLFWGNTIATCAALLLVALFIPETRPRDEEIAESMEGDAEDRAVEGGLWMALRTRPYLLVFSALWTLYGFVYAQHRFALPLQTDALFGLHGAALYGSLMTLNAVTVIACTTPVVALTRRFTPLANEAIAGALYAAGFGMLAVIKSVPLFYLSTLLWSLGEVVDATNSGVYVANHTPKSHRGRFNSILPIIQGTGFTVSAPVIGALIEGRSPATAWPFLALVATVAAAGMLVLDAREQRSGRC